jgi:hypothetical protein
MKRGRRCGPAFNFYLLNRQLNRCNCSHCQADRGARRSAPQPPVQRPCVRQPFRSILPRTAPQEPLSRSRRPSLPAIGSMRRLGGVAASPEKLVAARCGGHPDPPLRDMRKSDIFTCRSNIHQNPQLWQVDRQVLVFVRRLEIAMDDIISCAAARGFPIPSSVSWPASPEEYYS